MAIRKTTSDRRSQSPVLAQESSTSDHSETSRLLGAGEPEDVLQDDGTEPVKEEWDGYKDFEGLPQWRMPSVYWLLGPFVLFTLAFGGVMVPKLNLIVSLVCRQYFAEQAVLDPTQPIIPVFVGGQNPQCNIPEVQSRVSTFTMAMSILTGLLSAMVAPRIGRLSDRYGRTRLLAFASTGGVVGEIITVLVAKFPNKIDYRWLILSSIADGATGSFTAGSILTQSYTSDCTPPSQRAVRIGLLQACLFAGLAFGPLLAGYFVKWTGSLLSVFYIIVGCHATFIFIIAFIVPESLVKRKRVAAQEKWAKEQREREHGMGAWLSRVQKVNPLEPLAILWPTSPGTSTRLRLNLIAFAICDVFIMGSSIASGPIVILYSELMFGWGTFESSQFISALSLVRVVTLMGLLPIINYFTRVLPARRRRAAGIAVPDRNSGSDRIDIWMIRVALVSEVVGCVGYFFARSGAVFAASGMMTALGGLGGATVQASVTKHVPQQKVGQVLGAIGMLHALARVFGPFMYNGIYATTVGTFPQAFFLVLTSVFAFGLLISLLLRPRVHWEADDHDEDEPEPVETRQATNEALLALDEDQPIIH